MAYMSQPSHKTPEVFTPWHRLAIYTTPAISKRTLDGQSTTESIKAGDIVVVPINVSYTSDWMGGEGMIQIGLNSSLFAYTSDDAINLRQTKLVPQFATPDPVVYQLGLSLKTILEQDPTGSRLYVETTAAMLAVHLLQHYGQQRLEFRNYSDGLPRSILRQVLDYIQTNLSLDLGLAELAAIAYLSPHYFMRLFKQSTGLTPHQFVIRCRVERAKTLLLNGNGSISDIAQQVGFANQAHLNVHIKRSLGVTPKMILKQRKNR